MEEAVARIEKDSDTEVGIALYDGLTVTQAGSLSWLPAWSTMKVPIAMAAAEHCEAYDDDTIEQLTTAAIEWSDNDAARALWDCMGTDDEASALVAAEVAKAGTRVAVRGAFGTTRWSFAGQARYAHYLSQVDEDNAVVAAMHHIAEDQAYGLGHIKGVPFKGGWSDFEPDGSWHTRQFGWLELDGVRYGVAVGARSEAGSYGDTMDALDAVAEELKERA
ncbi:hypothetical protein A0K93_06020 [Corynebacterium sp. BCW_4722]|nr:hypothetical protein A0K93_06020 [Corynebacterium sp. BCW_4722]